MLFHTILFYGSYLVFPFILLLIFLWKKQWPRWLIILLAILSILFIDARFIEPNIFQVNTHSLSLDNASDTSIRIAVVSDPHIGIYRSAADLKREVRTIKKQAPDIVLIPGDFIYYIPQEKLEEVFSAYAELDMPVYAVAGNHDSESPGDIPSNRVREAIAQSGIVFVDNREEQIVHNGVEIHILGLSDIWEGNSDFSLLDDIQKDEHSIVLVHNPDAVYEFSNHNADLVFAGHTHAGQVRIPWLYKKAIPTEHNFDKGWYEFDDMKLFITAGTGMVGLPLRFLNPPQIDVFNVQL